MVATIVMVANSSIIFDLASQIGLYQVIDIATATTYHFYSVVLQHIHCTVTYVVGETTTTGRQIYDKNGDLFVKVDAQGNTTKYRYTYTKTDYDKDGTFERTLTELVTYDEWENVKTKTSYSYDKNGNRISLNTIDGDNKIIQKYNYSYSAEKPVFNTSRR